MASTVKVNVNLNSTVKSFNELQNKYSQYSWDTIYQDFELGKQIGEDILALLEVDPFVYIHDGRHHADDIFCRALLYWILGYKIEVERIDRNDPRLNEHLTLDCGLGLLDHHRVEEYRDSSCKEGIFASAGKLWATLGRTIKGISPRQHYHIDSIIFARVDHVDNLGGESLFYLSRLLPKLSYGDAVVTAKQILEVEILSAINATTEEEGVAEVADKQSENLSNGFLIFDKYPEVDKPFLNSIGAEWIVFPTTGRPTYTVRTTGDSLIEDSLRGVRSESDPIQFVHLSGFMAEVNNIDTAIDLIKNHTTK